MHESIILLVPAPTRIAHTIPLLLHDDCAIYDPPPTPLVYAKRHTILVMAISCKGQTEEGLAELNMGHKPQTGMR